MHACLGVLPHFGVSMCVYVHVGVCVHQLFSCVALRADTLQLGVRDACWALCPVQLCVYTCTYVHIYMYTCTCMYMCVDMYICVYVCVYRYVHIRTYIRMPVYDICTYEGSVGY